MNHYIKFIDLNQFIYWNDACHVDYRLLYNNHFPNIIDYLQIDLDVNNRSILNVLKILDKIVFKNYTFATVTFKHYTYSENYDTY